MEYTTKCRIYPNKEQQIQIAKTFGCCRFVWNHYLVLREFFYRNCITKDDGSELWTKFDSIKDLVFLKDQYPWLCEADAIALQATVEDIDRAYQNFFRGCKTGKRIGYPRFKTKRNPKQSYRTKAVGNNIQIDYEHGRVKLRKLGWVKIRLSKRVSGRILNATVSKNASGKYFLAICWTDVRMHSLPATGQTTGIDLGLKDLAVFSDGRKIDNIRVMKQGEARLARAQRRLSRKQKGSHRYAKQAKRVAVIHEKIGSITKVVGWGVSLIGFTAGIKEFKEEVVIVGISVSLASKGLDFVIDSLNFARRDFECGVGNDALEMAVQKSAEPE